MIFDKNRIYSVMDCNECEKGSVGLFLNDVWEYKKLINKPSDKMNKRDIGKAGILSKVNQNKKHCFISNMGRESSLFYQFTEALNPSEDEIAEYEKAVKPKEKVLVLGNYKLKRLPKTKNLIYRPLYADEVIEKLMPGTILHFISEEDGNQEKGIPLFVKNVTPKKNHVMADIELTNFEKDECYQITSVQLFYFGTSRDGEYFREKYSSAALRRHYYEQYDLIEKLYYEIEKIKIERYIFEKDSSFDLRKLDREEAYFKNELKNEIRKIDELKGAMDEERNIS